MLTKIKLYLKSPMPLTYNNGSLFHGALAERLSGDYADFLHKSGLKPYSQYIDCKKDEYCWVVQTLNEEAQREIISNANLEHLKTLYLKHLDTHIEITRTEMQTITREELLAQTYFADCRRVVKILFATPTSFKVAGNYMIYPTLGQIFRSLVQKYDAFSQNTEIYSENLIGDLTEYITVIAYNMRSTRFHVEGVKIPSFLGTLKLRISGPQQLVNLTHLLIKYGTYSGVGIKTAMGMGAFKILGENGD